GVVRDAEVQDLQRRRLGRKAEGERPARGLNETDHPALVLGQIEEGLLRQRQQGGQRLADERPEAGRWGCRRKARLRLPVDLLDPREVQQRRVAQLHAAVRSFLPRTSLKNSWCSRRSDLSSGWTESATTF